MSLVVEDGTGLADADSYVDVNYVRAYADKYGLTVDDDDTVVERKAREATEFVDSFRRYKGVRSKASQAREFPRTGLTDWSGLDVAGIPLRLKDATAYLTCAAHEGNLFADQDRGGRIKSESVGQISVTYADDAPAGKVFTRAEKLLEQYVRDASEPLPQLGFEAPASGQLFSVGMDDYPGTSTPDLISEA